MSPCLPAADRTRPIPAHAGARLDAAQAALAALAHEEWRLERLALAPALARCREERRYWSFLTALFSLEPRGIGE